MGRAENRLFAIGDQLVALDNEEASVLAELEFHRHIADDAERDAIVGGGEFDRLDAGLTRADVTRFEKRLAEINRQRAKLQATRTKLLSRLEH
jgi:hypothetical protein